MDLQRRLDKRECALVAHSNGQLNIITQDIPLGGQLTEAETSGIMLISAIYRLIAAKNKTLQMLVSGEIMQLKQELIDGEKPEKA